MIQIFRRFLKPIAALIFWLALASPGNAAEPCAPWVAGNPDGNYIVPGAAGDVVYRTTRDRRLALDAWVPSGPGPHPAAIIIHGGKWERGSRVAHVTQLFEPLARAGIAWFSVDYRLAPDSPMAAQDDLAEATRFVRCHASELRVDPARLALIGEDTGATMAVMEAAEDPGLYRGVVSVGGVFPERSSPQSSFVLPQKFPPMLVIHGAGDRDVPQTEAQRFCSEVRANTPCQYYTVEGAIHNFENWRPEQQHYKAELILWLRDKLGLPRLEISEITSLMRAPFPRRSAAAGLHKDVEYAPGLKLDAWVPRGAGPHPAVIIAHGGGWEAGDKVTYVAPLFEPLAKAGLAWFSIDYRLTPAVRHPQQLDDLRRAIRWVRHNAARFRVDPRRIAILGESASAQMVVQVASQPCEGIPAASDATHGASRAREEVDRLSCRPDAVVSFYGVYNFLAMSPESGPRPLLARLFGLAQLDDEARALLRDHSPLTHAHRGLPPILIVQGTKERLYEQAVEYARRLKEVGARHELYLLEGAPHGLENWEGRAEWQGYKKRLVDWLRQKQQ